MQRIIVTTKALAYSVKMFHLGKRYFISEANKFMQ